MPDISLAPITGTSGTRTFILNLDQLCRASLRKVGNKTPNPQQMAEAKESLNLWTNALQNEGIQLWSQQDWIVPVIGGQVKYALESAVIDGFAFYWRLDGSDRIITTMNEYDYAGFSNKETSGPPHRIMIDWQLANPYATFYPVYDTDTGFVIGSDGNSWLCKKSHMSTLDTKPVTGADYATCWEPVDLQNASNLWTVGVAYSSGVVRFKAVLRTMDITESEDNPDLPVKWARAVVWNNALELAPEYGLPKWERDDLKTMAALTLANAKAGNEETIDLRLSPMMR